MEKGLGIKKGQKISYLEVFGDYYGDLWPEPRQGYYRGVRRNGEVVISPTPKGRTSTDSVISYAESPLRKIHVNLFGIKPNRIVRVDPTGEPIKLTAEEPHYYYEHGITDQPYRWKDSILY